MTWEPGKLRWRKMFQGKLHFVSCLQLGVPPTKEASYQKANAWWRSKEAELRNAPPPEHPHQEVIEDLVEKAEWAKRNGDKRTEEDLARRIRVVESLPYEDRQKLDRIATDSPHTDSLIEAARRHGVVIPDDLDPLVKDLLFGSARVWEGRFDAEEKVARKIPAEKTIGGLYGRYIETHDLRRKAGDLSPGEYYLIDHHTKAFVQWIGPNQSPEITPDRWEDWWKYLLNRVSVLRMLLL